MGEDHYVIVAGPRVCMNDFAAHQPYFYLLYPSARFYIDSRSLQVPCMLCGHCSDATAMVHT